MGRYGLDGESSNFAFIGDFDDLSRKNIFQINYAPTEQHCQRHSTRPRNDVLRYSLSSRVSQSLRFPLPCESVTLRVVGVFMVISLRRMMPASSTSRRIGKSGERLPDP
jgi:hypothetical protein